MSFRPIAPLALPHVKPAAVPAARPEFLWLAPAELLVDEAYQRDLTPRSIRLIEDIVAGFDWSRFAPPIVTEVDGAWHVVDGQHTAIAAATLGVPAIPCFAVAIGSLAERALAFAGRNRDRIRALPFDIHRALVAAGDEDALTIELVLRDAGVRLVKFGAAKIGETQSIVTIRRLVARRGRAGARKALACLVAGRVAPIGESEMLAADAVLAAGADPEDLAQVIRVEGPEGASRAKAKAGFDRTNVWKALADIWTERLRKRRAA